MIHKASEDDHIIDYIMEIGSTFQILADLKVEYVKNAETDDGDSLETLLLPMFINPVDLDPFLKMYIAESSGTIQSFWTNVESEFGSNQRIKLQQGLQLMAITGMQPEMMADLSNSIGLSPVWEVLVPVDVA